MFAKRSLAELFGLKAVRQNVNQIAEKSLNYVAPSKLFAARELLRRALEENMADEACSFNSPAAVKDYLRLHLGGREEEHFVAIWLDAQHRLIAVDSLFRGTLSQTSVYPREVVKSGLKFNACSVIFAHYVARHKMGIMCPDFLCARRKPLRRRLGFVVQWQGT